MADEDYKTQIALLTQQVATLLGKISEVETRAEKRIEKVEAIVKWVGLLMASAVLSQVLRVAGIGL